MSKDKSQRNLLNFLRSHNQSMAEHGFRIMTIQLQLRLLVLCHCCLNKRAFKEGWPWNPHPLPRHSLSLLIQNMGAGVYSLPYHVVQPYLRSSGLSLGGGTVLSTVALCWQISGTAQNPTPGQFPVISEWGLAHSTHLTLLIDVRRAQCKHWTSVCVYKSHYKHHQEWEKNKASLFTVWEREKKPF